MALKSSQPRRNASPRSEKVILRTTYVVETPKNCSLGLANMVAIAPPPCCWERSALENARIRLVREDHDRARQTEVNEEKFCRATLVATSGATLARCPAEAKPSLQPGNLAFNGLLRCVDG